MNRPTANDWQRISHVTREAEHLLQLDPDDDHGLHACGNLAAHGLEATEIAGVVRSLRRGFRPARPTVRVRAGRLAAWAAWQARGAHEALEHLAYRLEQGSAEA